MIIRGVRLVAETPVGQAEFDHTFAGGLTVIRGSNTVGKSLLVQAILYGLGLDDLFATRKGMLTRAMSSDLNTHLGVQTVVRSYVELEFSVGQRIITVRRFVRTPEDLSPSLVLTWDVPAITAALTAERRGQPDEYFVNYPGSAVEERGFHTFMARLLGWSPPLVSTYDSSLRPLYLQLMFGLGYVDQKHGWGGVVPQVPTKYGIIEPLRHAVQFILDLDVLRRMNSRREIDATISMELQNEARVRNRIAGTARAHGARVLFPNLPNLRARSLDKAMQGVAAASVPQIEVLESEGWVELGQFIESLETTRSEDMLPATSAAQTESTPAESLRLRDAETALHRAEGRLAVASSQLAALNEGDSLLEMQLGSLGRRLSSLEDEKRRYGQLQTLSRLGGHLAPSSLHDNDCPTCHQSLLAVEAVEGNALGVEETINVLGQDVQTVQNMIEQAGNALTTNDVRRTVWNRLIAELRAEIRALKSDLVSTNATPSVASIQRALVAQNRLSACQQLEVQIIEDIEAWTQVQDVIIESVTDRYASPEIELSAADQRKMRTWTTAMQNMLESFRFESVSPSLVALNEEMKPVVDEYDISFQGSASDGIRLRWAYLLSLLAEGLGMEGNHHPGFLIMDEPGQQGVEASSLAELYRRCADVATAGQVLLTTSEPREQIATWLADRPHSYVEVPAGGLLQLK